MITLSSDFGSPYPAAMKGAILTESDARLVDVTHDFPRQDVRTAAFWLREVLPEFPPAVHLVVIDPGVGTDRRAIVLRAGEHALVGPDNGVLAPASRALRDAAAGDDGGTSAIVGWEILVEDPASATFHGRDVFAPAAATVHEAGIDELASIDRLESIDDWTDLAFPEPTIDEGTTRGEVLVVDGFGTAITNVPGAVIEDRFGRTVEVDGKRVAVERSYAQVAPGTPLVTVGSHGKVELAVNQGRGVDAFDVEVGASVRLDW